MQALKILLAAAFTLLSCLALGKVLLKRLRIELYRSEELFFAFVLGSAVLSMIVLLLGTLRLAYAPVFFIVGCAMLALAYYFQACSFTPRRLSRLPRAWSIVFIVVYACWACVYFVAALAPEASADGPVYHVALPALYLREHRIVPLTSNLLADLSEGIEMLYLFAFAFGKHSASSMVHLLFTLLTPIGMLSFGKRIGSPHAGVIGALLFFLSPAVALVGTVAYVDVAVVAVSFAAFYLLQIWWVEQNDTALIPIGMLAGFCFGIKYTAGIAIPYALGCILVRRTGSCKPVWKPCATVALTALALMSPWMLKNAVVVHNPLAPFVNQVFPNPFLYPSIEQQYASSISSMGGLRPLNWLYEITTRGGFTQGFLGPVFLLAPFALLAASSAAGRQVLCAGAVFLLPCIAAVPSRYFLPSLCFLSLALGLVVSRTAYTAFGVIVLHVVLSWPAVIPKYAARNSPRFEWPDWRAAARLTPESDYLSARVEGYGIGQLLDIKLLPHQRAFAFRLFEQAYHAREVVVGWQSAFGTRLGESLRTAFDPSMQPVKRYSLSFEPVATSKIRLVRTEGPDADHWGIAELRIYSAGRELPRDSAWRLNASPNPWEVQFAFDNSPLTHWDSRQRASQGMYIEVDFGRIEKPDRLTADTDPDQAGIGIGLRMEHSGIWQDCPARMEMMSNPMPPRLRRGAIEGLERQDINALVIHDLDPGASDFLRRQAQWGIELAGTSGRYRLYLLK